MAHKAQAMDVSRLPDVLSLAEQVKRTKTPRILIRADGEELARLVPPKQRTPKPTGKRITADDPIWDIVGMGSSAGGLSNVSEHVDEFLAEWEVSQHRP